MYRNTEQEISCRSSRQIHFVDCKMIFQWRTNKVYTERRRTKHIKYTKIFKNRRCVEASLQVTRESEISCRSSRFVDCTWHFSARVKVDTKKLKRSKHLICHFRTWKIVTQKGNIPKGNKPTSTIEAALKLNWKSLRRNVAVHQDETMEESELCRSIAHEASECFSRQTDLGKCEMHEKYLAILDIRRSCDIHRRILQLCRIRGNNTETDRERGRERERTQFVDRFTAVYERASSSTDRSRQPNFRDTNSPRFPEHGSDSVGKSKNARVHVHTRSLWQSEIERVRERERGWMEEKEGVACNRGRVAKPVVLQVRRVCVSVDSTFQPLIRFASKDYIETRV